MKATPLPQKQPSHTELIRVRGIVQGVGFRPTVCKLSQQFRLVGTVCNDGDGVLIKVHGQSFSIDAFIDELIKKKPLLARIDNIERTRLSSSTDLSISTLSSFEIIKSSHSNANTGITADAATCDACLADIFDETNLRYKYPFTNCTHCGPRLSIIKGIPYDRAQTSMNEFDMCPNCLHEYESPDNRRFHAQPNACPECGPKIWLEDNTGKLITTSNDNRKLLNNPVAMTKQLLQGGAVVAIKGIGGIHLAVDASNEKAIQSLRDRKQRPQKPFALMMKNMAMIESFCEVDQTERGLLTSPAAPIVLLRKKTLPRKLRTIIAKNIAPRQKTLGAMLPYTPLHHLLLNELDTPIVLTSANASHEPQCIDNNHARSALSKIADYFLLHNRTIENRVDDSVVRTMADKPQFYRRARGYAPESFCLPQGFKEADAITALGGELKNTFCFIQNGQAILSQHIGDLENYKTYEDYRHNLALYEKLFQHQAKHIAIDAHPEYISNKAGHEISDEQRIPLHTIQHHHAHIASCLADNQYPLEKQAVLGIALDGLGYGDNDTLWGGEFLFVNYLLSKRLAHFKPIPLLGGSVAMKQPWRNTYAHLHSCLGWNWISEAYPELELVRRLSQKPLTTFDGMMKKGINCPTASSAGRLFDAVAGALDICSEALNYEGQAAIELENCIDPQSWFDAETSAYNFYTNQQLDPTPMWKGLLEDLSVETPPPLISARFHKGLANAIITLSIKLANENHLKTIALSGGVFQNKTLFEAIKYGLEQESFNVLAHHNVPANDGGIALGQAVITAARILADTQKPA